jgi:spore coat protein CotH
MRNLVVALLGFVAACTATPLPGQSWVDVPDRADALPPPPVASGTMVVINEVQASNKSTWQDPSNWELPDWVELYNSGTSDVLLSDLTLTDGSGNTWRGPDDGVLAVGDTLMLIADNDNDDFHLPFNLSAVGGDTLVLTLKGSRTDIVPVGVLDDDLSLARIPDGGPWMATARPTPGWSNGSSPSESLDPADGLFAAFEMHEIEVRVSPSLFNAIDNRNPEPCSLTIDGIYYPKVAIKNTGQGSFDSITGKPRLVFNLDAFDSGAEFRGVDNLELHNGKTWDETRGRDWATYRYARMAGIPSSRVGFAHLTLNGQNYGLYVLVEDTDDKWLSARFPASADTGMIFEGGDIGSIEQMEYEVGPVPPNPQSVASLHAADAIESGPSSDRAIANLWNYLEHDEILNYIAWEGITNDWDGYDAPHNYRWYVDGVTHRTMLVPSGVEITWTGDPDLWGSNGNLADFCFANDACSRDYAQHVLAMADLADAIDVARDFDDLMTWLRPYIAADPRAFDSMQQTLDVWASSMGNMRDNPQEARSEIYGMYPDLRP